MIDPSSEPEFELGDRAEHYRSQNYRRDWEKIPALQSWLKQGKNPKRARCTICDVEMTADICVIKSHGRGIRHNRRLRGSPFELDARCGAGHYNPKWEVDPAYSEWLRKGRLDSKAECTLCDVEFRAEKTVLKNHSKSKRHARAELHAKRVREMAKIWGAEKRLVNDGDPSSAPRAHHPASTAGTSDVADIVAKYVVRGYKKLQMKCLECQTSLLRGPNGTVICILCSEASDDDNSKESTESVSVMEVVSEDGGEEEEGGGAYFTADDGALMYLEVVRKEEGGGALEDDSSDNSHVTQLPGVARGKTSNRHAPSVPGLNECVVQGVDLSSEVQRLVKVLRCKLSAVNARIEQGDNLASALQQLQRIVSLLDKIKML